MELVHVLECIDCRWGRSIARGTQDISEVE
jgi:hypothetical protein